MKVSCCGGSDVQQSMMEAAATVENVGGLVGSVDDKPSTKRTHKKPKPAHR